MPRKDHTFSDKDVIRIVNKHLTSEERFLVFVNLCGIFKPELLQEELQEAGITPETSVIETTLFVEKITFGITTLLATSLPRFIAAVVTDVVEDVEFLQDLLNFATDEKKVR